MSKIAKNCEYLSYLPGGVLSTPPQQNGYNSLKFHATDLKLGSKFSSGRWLQIYEVNKQDLENEKGI